LWGLFNVMAGLAKLEGRAKPSTSFFGNKDVLSCVGLLSETRVARGLSPVAVRAVACMGKSPAGKGSGAVLGKGPPGYQRVRAGDGPDAVRAQWEAVKAWLTRPGTVLLLHLTNHYAPVYAYREWWTDEAEPGPGVRVPEEGESLPGVMTTIVRQVLTARKGQRPTAWIDFEDLRSILCGWEGYKLMLLERAYGAAGYL